MVERWSVEQVQAVAPSPAAVTAARGVATPASWGALGASDEALWGRCRGSGAEPYDTIVDHVHVAFGCSCPSRRRPCKHALALLLLWIAGTVPDGTPPPAVEHWLERQARARPSSAAPGPPASATETDGAETITGGEAGRADGSDQRADGEAGRADGSDQRAGGEAGRADGSDQRADGRAGSGDGSDQRHDGDDARTGDGSDQRHDGDDESPPPGDDRDADRDAARDERVARMAAGLTELDRWLDDRIRTGLADPAVARYGTWDALAARLVDAQAGSLANRIRRLAGVVGATPHWHDDLLAELGMLHLLARAGRHLGDLPAGLADRVATTVGWQVRQADVLAGVPDSDDWLVAARSDQREDRIEVRRHWLRGVRSGGWALVLSFAAFQQSLDDSLRVGDVLRADLHRYPGPALRALVGRRFGDPRPVCSDEMAAPTLVGACAELGRLLVDEPWLDRVPAIARAALRRRDDRWVLGDDDGSLPIHPDHQHGDGIAALLAISAGAPVTLAFEWTPHGVIPTTLFPDDDGEVHDLGPRADPSFVAAA